MANSETSARLVTVIGGSGFLGRQITRALANRGYRVRVGCRRPDLAGHVQPQGTPGQIMPVQANVRFPDSILAACDGACAVINVPGILYKSGAQSFESIHIEGAHTVARAARACGAEVFVQMSSLGADPASASDYARSKGEGELAVRNAFPGASILRPSVIFGPGDAFFNRFAEIARVSPFMPLFGGGTSKFQPVFVGDVAQAAANLVDGRVRAGETWELGGPEVMSLRAVMEFILRTIGRKRMLLNIPWPIARLQGALFGLMPHPLLTSDQVLLLQQDNVVSVAAAADRRTLEGLGVTPQGIESIVPSYLYRFRKEGQFTAPN